MKSAGIDVSGLTVGAVINTSSGGCDSESEGEMLDILNSAGVTNCKIWCGASDRIERAFAEAAAFKPKMLGPFAQLQKGALEPMLSSPASRRDTEDASSGAVWRRVVAGCAWNYARRACNEGAFGWWYERRTIFSLPRFSVPLACGRKRANPYVNATLFTPTRKVPSLSNQCSTQKFGIPF